MEQFQNPLIVQSDRTILLDVHAPRSEECRNALIPFAELERSPEHLHTYRLTPLSLWNAASAGISTQQIIQTLREFSRYQIPQNIEMWIFETAERFGKLRLVQIEENKIQEEKSSEENSPPRQEFLYLESADENIFKQIQNNSAMKKFLSSCEKPNCFLLALTDRGIVKQKLLEFGWPVKDEAPLREGETLEINLREKTLSGNPLVIREYQIEAAESIVADKRPGTGFGTIALPCGSGKTIVGMKIMSMLKTSTLIITTNITAVHQWIDELLDKTNLTREQIAEYTGENKTIAPVTIATYQILTWRPDKESSFPHFSIFRERAWGLIIYDEVHLLPAPVFRVVAELQAVRRVGLTATLVREDGCQGHVFSLVGPKRYDIPWKELEKSGFIASARCIELRVNLPEHLELEYAVAPPREKHKIASTNPAKIQVAKELVEKFSDDKILVIGQYLNQLKEIAELLKVPLITGKTPNAEREKIYADFRSGKNRVIVVSKVANFAVDLPDASMAVELSGAFGSRQEEAQRLGRILRPKNLNKPGENFSGTSKFFTIITRRTSDEDFGSNRQKFLAEQGYSYKIILYNDAADLEQLQERALMQNASESAID
ncbi:MAG: DEAD/DEAH box helicase [Treponema sp.]|nr:DEAD/DEAH box helicase [Treponema sp.]